MVMVPSAAGIEVSFDAIAEAVCTVFRSRAALFEHAPTGPLADAIRAAVVHGFLDSVGNGVVEISEEGRALALAKDPVRYAMTFIQCKASQAKTGGTGAVPAALRAEISAPGSGHRAAGR